MLNYSAHAIGDLLNDMRIAHRQGRSRDAEQTATFIDDVRRGHKFVLPDHGSLIYDMREVPEGIEITRLPFPTTVMEVPFPPTGTYGEDVLSASRRLILAKEGVFTKPGIDFRAVRTGETPNAVKIAIACWYDRDRRWILQPDGAIVMIGWKSIPRTGPRPDDDRGDLFDGAALFEMITEPVLSDSVDIICSTMTYQEFVEQAGNDVASEIRMMAEMMTVLSCSNVGMEVQHPPEKLQKARLKSGKEPFHDVHVLTVNGEQLAMTATGPVQLDDNGFKVRQHVRRGHVRRLADGRRIWVNSTVVAAGSRQGSAEKVYRMTPMR